MKRLFVILLTLLFVLAPEAQTRRTTTKKKARTTKTTTRKNTKKSTKTATPDTKAISGLKGQRQQVQKKIKEQERLLRANKADVEKRLGNLMVINSEIDQSQKNIDGIEKDISGINENIELLKTQINTLEKQLQDRKEKYVKSLRYMAKNRNIQSQLMFIFSAKNFAQMYRRLRFVREYAAYQRAQGELVKAKQAQIEEKQNELQLAKRNKSNLLYKGKKEKTLLETKQTEQQQVVNTLQRQQKAIQKILDEQRKKSEQLNAEIDRLVAEEVAKARIRAAEEARQKAAAEAAAKKKRAEELARKKAEAERVAKENALRVKEAKEKEAKLKEKARKEKDAKEKQLAEQRARQAQAEREAAELKAEVDRKRQADAVAEAKKENREQALVSSVDRKLSRNFESNKGRFPIPVTGSYRIVGHYGRYNVDGLRGVALDNKGISILGGAGAQARAIFDGEVTAVFTVGGSQGVMVRHGSYISFYFNLSSVNVHRGQKVSTRQSLGTVASDHILQFQLRKETAKLNPEVWLGR